MEYKYICKHRPAMPGSIPSNGIVSVSDADKGKTGYYSLVTYSRQLGDAEVYEYELERVDYTTTELFPEIKADRDVMFLGTKDEQREYRRACTENLTHWACIIRHPRFSALQFVGASGNTYILHPSTRNGIDWQLTSIAPDGFANCHSEYTFYNKRDEFNLCQDLLDHVQWTGATVTVMYR